MENEKPKSVLDYAGRTLLTQRANRILDLGLFWCDEDIDENVNVKPLQPEVVNGDS